MTVIERASDRATPGFPMGLIPIAVYVAAIEAYILIEMMWPEFPLPTDILTGWDYYLSGRDGAHVLLAFAIWQVALWLAFVIAPILLVVAILRKRAFRPLLVIWFAMVFVYPMSLVVAASDAGQTWRMGLDTYAIIITVLVAGSVGILYVVRSSRLRAFFHR